MKTFNAGWWWTCNRGWLLSMEKNFDLINCLSDFRHAVRWLQFVCLRCVLHMNTLLVDLVILSLRWQNGINSLVAWSTSNYAWVSTSAYERRPKKSLPLIPLTTIRCTFRIRWDIGSSHLIIPPLYVLLARLYRNSGCSDQNSEKALQVFRIIKNSNVPMPRQFLVTSILRLKTFFGVPEISRSINVIGLDFPSFCFRHNLASNPVWYISVKIICLSID